MSGLPSVSFTDARNRVGVWVCTRRLLSATEKFVARGDGNKGNKQFQLVTQHLLGDKVPENVARIT